MASSQCKNLYQKRLNSKLRATVGNLREENAFLKTIVTQFFRKHSEHIRLVEQFLSVETARLEVHQQLIDKNEKLVSLSVQLGRTKGNRSERDCSSDESVEWTSSNKNNQSLENDQRREAYMRAVQDGMLWLENRQKETNAVPSQQHNQEHSDEKESLRQMQKRFERLLKEANDELEELRQQVDESQQELQSTQKFCKETEHLVEELRQQLRSQTYELKKARDVCLLYEDDEQRLKEETKDLKRKLDEERRRSASFHLQRKQQSSRSCDEACLQSSKCSLLDESFLVCPGCQTEYPASQYRELMSHLDVCLD